MADGSGISLAGTFTSEGLTMNELAGLHPQISELSEYEQMNGR